MRCFFYNRKVLLMVTLLFCIVSLFVAHGFKRVVEDRCYKDKIRAAEIMSRAMEAIKDRKLELGLPMDPRDIHATGIIGEQYSPITTTLGSIEAKRTSANPDMAALVVHLLAASNIKEGDTVGANFSGSFPALNIAVLSACEVLNVDVVYISSIGSSNYGANQPDFTFPDMANYLVNKGILSSDNSLVSPGGEDDIGSNMDTDVLEDIIQRIKSYGIEVMEESNFQRNVKRRREIFDNKTIDVFINVGGNITSMGLYESPESIQRKSLFDNRKIADDTRGLIDIYSSQGIPTINLLNIKRLTSEYGLPYDPVKLPDIGEGSIYHSVKYPTNFIVFSNIVILILLFSIKRLG